MLDGLALAAINHLLRGAPWARTRLQAHGGCSARVETPLFALRFRIDRDGWVEPASSADGDTDLTITVPASAFGKAIDGMDAIVHATRIEGQVEFAETLGFLLRNLDWDIEDDLSRWVGDIAARRIALALTGAREGGREAVRRFAAAISEYALHEAALGVAPAAAGEFATRVDDLRDQIERLEARIRRLEVRALRAEH